MGKCDLPLINEKYITEYLLAHYEELIPELEREKGHVTSGERVDHSARIKELDKRQEKYKQLFIRDFITIEEMEKEMEAIRQERQELHEPVSEEHIDEETFYNFMESWHMMNLEERQTFLKIIFKMIRIDAYGEKGKPKKVEIVKVM